ncbi:DUF6880 family protein [Rhizobium tumorigenes]|uniref:Uncharacterized protein n=1 Tax=Rhizobium tumorigenes TaxID=2041385 RepID=A0AAF1KC29_9HYPH|nr:DUF6880 family protein [Rhizobium tumorigenes]WFR96827.1 hypothetical protein PR017_06840 [Rhizobium tumorigenes]
MAAKTTLNAKNLETLGAGRLSELLIEISMGNAAHKRRLRLELAGAQSTAEVAREVRKRLSSIDRAKTHIDWRKIKALKSDLETQRTMISGTIAAGDPDEAMDLLWRFLELAGSIFARCDDSNGVIIGSFHAACIDLGTIAPKASHHKRLAEQVFGAIRRNEYGECDPLIPALAAALGQTGLAQLKKLLAGWQQEEFEVPKERVPIGWGMSGPVYADEIEARHRDSAVRIALQQIADAEGDVDAFVRQHSEKSQTVPSIAAQIATRLLAAGRAAEALAALDKAPPTGRPALDIEWQHLRIETLEALGREAEAQAFRWQCFERDLSVEHLKAYIKRLPDFDDIEAEEKAFAYVADFEDVHTALMFFQGWPAPAEAAKLVLARAGEIDGDLYEILAQAADWLQEKQPLAATILLRAMIDFSLEGGRSSRYRHAARHLGTCAMLASRIADFGAFPDHAAYVAALKRRRGKKHGFWSAVG